MSDKTMTLDLTSREREFLCLLIEKGSVLAATNALGISNNTGFFYLNSIQFKLNALKRSAAKPVSKRVAVEVG